MKDILEQFKKAKEKKVFKNQEEFIELLHRIQVADSDLELNWDDGAGEDWAYLTNEESGITCMLHAKIGIAFIHIWKDYEFKKIKDSVETLEVVFVESYNVDEWFINLVDLERDVPEIYWRLEKNSAAVDVNCFSLQDLYFATV